MKTKLMTLQEATGFFRDGMTIMVGGFMGIGTPSRLVEALLESGVRDLTLIANDTAFVDTGIGPLIVNGRVRKVIASHIGTNPETGRRMISGEMDVVLVPQGTLIEQIRCGGAGLGGFLTPTGVGTVVEEGKQTLTLDGKTWLLERPLRADLALIRAHRCDTLGNLTYHLSARNFNPLIALAADITLVEPDELVETGELQPDHSDDADDFLEEAGRTLQAAIKGLLDLQQQRNSLSDKHLRPLEDNPLRLNMDYAVALDVMFAEGKSPVHLAAPAAVSESLRNVRHHEEANRAAIVESLRVLLDAFSPRNLMRRFVQYRRSHELRQPLDDAGAWQMYSHYYEELASDRQQGFEMLFNEVYAQVYDRVLREKQREPEA